MARHWRWPRRQHVCSLILGRWVATDNKAGQMSGTAVRPVAALPRGAGPLAVTAASLAAGLAIIGFLIARGQTGDMVDLDVYRAGAEAIVHGGDLYAIRSSIGLQFTYPPASALLAVPAAVLPLGAAKAAWTAMV